MGEVTAGRLRGSEGRRRERGGGGVCCEGVVEGVGVGVCGRMKSDENKEACDRRGRGRRGEERREESRERGRILDEGDRRGREGGEKGDAPSFVRVKGVCTVSPSSSSSWLSV